jgi:hypothetical protein
MLLTVLRMRRARALTFFVSANVNICALAHGGHVRRFGRAQLSPYSRCHVQTSSIQCHLSHRVYDHV